MAECGEDFLLDEPIDDVEDSDDEPIDDFPPNFKEYMKERELKYSRLEISDKPPGYKSRSSYSWKGIRWVFWNPQDDDLTLSYDHSVDFIPDVCASRKVRLDVRLALRKLILHPELNKSLVQFWAPTRTLEGRTLLTTQFQPFALGKTYDRDETKLLCEYRVWTITHHQRERMCGGAIIADFFAIYLWSSDAKKKKNPSNYFSKPLRSEIVVLEGDDFEADFQDFKDYSDDEDQNDGGVKPFAFSASNSSGLSHGAGLGEALSVEVIDFQNGQRSHSIQTIPATRCVPGLELLKDGEVMMQLGQVEQPSMDVINSGMHVVSEAQNYNLPVLDYLQYGKVTKQVDSSYQQSMDPSNKGQNAVTVERNILVVSSSKKVKRKTQDEEHKNAGVRIEVPLEEILKCSKMRREDAAKELEVSISTLKRVCRDFGINRWPPRNIEDPRSNQPLPVENLGQTPQLNYDLPSNQASASVAHIKPSFQDADMVTIIAICGKNMIKFRLSWSSRLVEMQQEVAKRLNLEGGTYSIKYRDEEDLLILIACDEDLQYCLHTYRSMGMSKISILLEQK